MKHATIIRLKVDYVDLGLPSGTLWATKNLTIGKQKHFTHYEAMLLSKIYKHLELPSKEDFKELLEHCTWKWMCVFGKIAGYKVTGPNGNSIFLSASGYYSGTTLLSSGTYGGCWSADFSSSSSAYCLYFNSSSKGMSSLSRYFGQSIRAVRTHH